MHGQRPAKAFIGARNLINRPAHKAFGQIYRAQRLRECGRALALMDAIPIMHPPSQPTLLPVAEANDRYVLTMARCCCVMSSSSAELKLGQNTHRNMVPTIANMSDVYDDASCWPALLCSSFGRIMKLTAKPKYAPNACTVIEPPTSVICGAAEWGRNGGGGN